MAFPTIAFNSSTGSDTQASGAGPSTALFGTAASFAASVVTLDGSPDLTNVATDGSHVLWMDCDSGGDFFKITAKDNGAKTVTVTPAPAGTATGRTWGIGGKRNDLNGTSNRTLFTTTAGLLAGWTLWLESNVTLTSQIVLANGKSGDDTDGYITVTGPTSGNITITTATNSTDLFDGAGTKKWRWQNINFTNTASTRGIAFEAFLNGAVQFWHWDNCKFDGFTYAFFGDNSSHWYFDECLLTRCEVKNSTTKGMHMAGRITFIGCYIHDNTGEGVYSNTLGSSAGQFWTFIHCVITDNAGRGVHWAETGGSMRSFTFINCTIEGNGDDGIFIAGTSALTRSLYIVNNIFYGNTGTQVEMAATVAIVSGCFNAFGGGTARGGFSALPGDVTLSADPFTSASGDDYTLNNTAGGGAACRAAGIPALIG